MSRARPPIYVLMLLIPVFTLLGAWQWPVNPQLLERGFAASLGSTGIERGVVFDAEGEEVMAVANGTVIYRDTGESESTGIPRRGGIVVLEHPNGFRSFYSGLRPEGPSAGERVLQGRTVGIGGEHGVRFELFDVRRGWYANPFDLLELLPDSGPPVISGIMLVTEHENRSGEPSEQAERTVLPVYNRASHPSGRAEVYIRVRRDADGQSQAYVPQRVALTQGGWTVHEIAVSRVEVSGGEDRVVWDGGSRTADSMYGGGGWIRVGTISVPEGSSVSFTARAFDYRGNEQTRVFTVDGVSQQE